MPVGQDMIIDAVDATDHPVGVVQRRDVFRVHANFRVAHVLIFNSKGEILLQRLALSRDRNPGAWGSSVAAYLYSTEDYMQAAQRRIGQELGISDALLVPVGKTEMVDEGSLKFIMVFRHRNDGPFRYDPSHIDGVEFVPVPDVSRMVLNEPRSFTPTFHHVFRFYRSQFGQ